MNHFFVGFAVAMVLAHPPTSQSRVPSNSCSGPKLQELAKQWAGEHHFSGTVLVEQHETPLAKMAFGEADYEHQAANTVETPFRIGSITKLFTAVAILREVADGRLQLSTPICRFLPDCPASWQVVTVEQALTHTDGLPDIVQQPEFAAMIVQPTDPVATLRHLYGISLGFSPGTDVAYGNSGMLALSAILEKLNGEKYGGAVNALVILPARLEHTAYDDPTMIVPGRARGYTLEDGKLQNASYIDMTLPSGAGGLLSTVVDLDRFTRAFLSGKIVPSTLVHESLAAKNADYGFGWAIRTSNGQPEISHIGDINGFGSFLAYYPAQDLVTVVLTNVERTPVADFARLLAGQCRVDSPH
jgi:CubicO group peptidase (beta-lactamase class C family)